MPVFHEKGETLAFGDYEWRVLDVQDDRALLITKDVVEKRIYDTFDKAKESTWEKCALRKYLNGEFYDKFSDDEKRLILDATDKIFLLSIDEAEKYFTDDLDRVAYYQGSVRWWWLRSIGIRNHAAHVERDGYVNTHGYRVDYIYSGVRPALYLKLR